MANIIVSPLGQKHLEGRLLEFFRSIDRDEEWLSAVGLMIASKSSNADLTEKVFDALTVLFPTSTQIANLYAKVIAQKASEEALSRAIDVCKHTITAMGDNLDSRVQLITYLILKGDEASTEEAKQELDQVENEPEASPDVEKLRQLLSPTEPREQIAASLLRISAPDMRELDDTNLLPQLPEATLTRLTLPSAIALSGELRQREFTVRRALTRNLAAAQKRLKDIIAENPTFAYARLLAERHADWIKSNFDLKTFAIAFERALRSNDKALLVYLSSKHPKLEALCLVARSLCGDEKSFDQISATISSLREKKFPPLVTLERIVAPMILESTGPINFAAFPKAKQDQIRQVLYSANEATLM